MWVCVMMRVRDAMANTQLIGGGYWKWRECRRARTQLNTIARRGQVFDINADLQAASFGLRGTMRRACRGKM